MQVPVHLISSIKNTNIQQSMPTDNNLTLERSDAYNCNICGNEFRKEGNLKRHMRVHLSKQSLSGGSDCQVCKLSFQNNKDLAYHTQVVHSHDLALKCSQCGCFRPVTENSQSKPFKCEGCAMNMNQILPLHPQQVLYPAIQQLPLIPAVHHPIPLHSQSSSTPMHNAYNIERITDGTTNVNDAHMKLKLTKIMPTKSYSPVEPRPAKPYKCVECNKGFSHSSTLAMHKKLHTGDYKYMCEYCDKTFMLNEYYTRHMRVHTKEKPYKCEVCCKAFSQSNTLTQHKRTHTGEKPYACELCGRHFSVRDYLNKHVRTHTGEKPYVCQVCDKKYSQASGLRAHQKQHSHFQREHQFS